MTSMVLFLNSKATPEPISEVTKISKNYTKIVVDIEKGVLAAEGDSHIDCEQTLHLASAITNSHYHYRNGRINII